MRALVILDPPETLYPTTDTSVALVDEMLHRGHEVWACQPNDVGMQGLLPKANATQILKADRHQRPALTLGGDKKNQQIQSFETVLIRKDPPFDTSYLLMTQMLEFCRGDVFFFNDPKGLREFNEKLAIFYFPEWIVPTLVSASLPELENFLLQSGGIMVLKPLTGYGGQGILIVRSEDPNTKVILELMTQNGQQAVMVQRYLPQVKQGDKRILLLEGKPIGTLLRVPSGVEIRSNLRSGGQALQTSLTARDYELCEALAPRLMQEGLHFVGIDVIGGYLTEINVTSPTGVQVANRLNQTFLEQQIVDFIEHNVEEIQKTRGQLSGSQQ